MPTANDCRSLTKVLTSHIPMACYITRPDTAGAVREIHRVLRVSGQARVMLYHRGSFAYWSQVIVRYGILRGEFLRGKTSGGYYEQVCRVQ